MTISKTPFTRTRPRRRHRPKAALRLLLAGGLIFLPLISARTEPPLNADNAVRLALGNNPELQAARHLVAEAEARARTSGRLSNPEVDTELAGGPDKESRAAAGLTQRFPLTSRLRLERSLSTLEIEIARAEIRNQERLLETAVRSAFYELTSARTAIALGRMQSELATSFADSLSESVHEGFGSVLDGQQAGLSASMLKARMELLAADEATALGRLNNLLGRPADAAFPVNGTLDLPRELPARHAAGDRPDLHLAELLVEAGTTDVSLAEASRWEDVGVGVFIEGEQFRTESGGPDPETLIGVRFSIPLPLWQNGSGKVAEKNAIHSRRVQTLEALRLTAANEALMAHSIMEIRYRTARDMQDNLVPAARRQATDAEAAYMRGELPIANVFQARERFIETESTALEARKNYFLSHAEWLGALGGTKHKEP